MPLNMVPKIYVEAAKCTASSDCCGVGLDPGPKPETYLCQACGESCERVLSNPETVIFNG